MPNHDEIYRLQAEQYDRLIARQPSLLPVINGIRPVRGLDIVDAGAGTGRLAAVLAPLARTITAFDASETMLQVAAAKLAAVRKEGWRCTVADNRSLPLPDASADLLLSGWSVCYLASSNRPDSGQALAAVMQEFRRIVRPGGTIILFETMGSGTLEPDPPEFLLPYYEQLEHAYGFVHKRIRLDYSFASVEEAAELTGFFFGEELSRRVREKQWRQMPEYAGVWWLTTE